MTESTRDYYARKAQESQGRSEEYKRLCDCAHKTTYGENQAVAFALLAIANRLDELAESGIATFTQVSEL
jgi:hypothetical protein